MKTSKGIYIDGGVTAPNGFKASGILAGVKKGRTKPDLALIYSSEPCEAAGVFTANLIKAEPVKITQKHLRNGNIQAIIANSGNANACTGEQGYENAQRMAQAAASALSLNLKQVSVCSTGVIGQQINIDAIEKAVPSLVQSLSKEGHEIAREAIMTTDTVYKETAIQITIDGKTVTIGTMAKGSGMIHINMGTMLGFITTDCAISSEMLDIALKESVANTYNCVSIDGDTSTNDTLLILANGLARNKPIKTFGEDYDTFLAALTDVNRIMARKIAADGEGATHLIECTVTGAKDIQSARNLAKKVISSSLVKAAFFGKDANWGRILCAMGYSGEIFNPETTTVSFSNSSGTIKVFERGAPLNFDEEKAKIVLTETEVEILIDLKDAENIQGNIENPKTYSATAWGCDLTYDYVKINGDYRT